MEKGIELKKHIAEEQRTVIAYENLAGAYYDAALQESTDEKTAKKYLEEGLDIIKKLYESTQIDDYRINIKMFEDSLEKIESKNNKIYSIYTGCDPESLRRKRISFLFSRARHATDKDEAVALLIEAINTAEKFYDETHNPDYRKMQTQLKKEMVKIKPLRKDRFSFFKKKKKNTAK